VRLERVVTAEELAEAAERWFPDCDVLLMAAAVGDFGAASPRAGKIRRQNGEVEVPLTPTPDILAGLAGRRRPEQVLVGFALETENEEEGGRMKLRRKGVDLVVVNNPRTPGAGFGVETNVVTLLEVGKQGRKLPLLSKREVAQRILDWVVKRRSTPPARRRKREQTAGTRADRA
jgi:phosphopantothenoylcysteine decarboxylase/phosphopantothenate--cysteine ligase